MNKTVPADLADGFSKALEAAPEQHVVSRHLVGGYAMRLSTVGRDLHSFISRPALELESDPAEPIGGDELHIELWDEGVSGVGRSRSPGPQGEISAGGWPESLMIDSPPRIRFQGAHFDLSLDRRTRRAIGWVRDSGRLRHTWHPGRPLHPVFMPWLADRGRIVIHGGCVAKDGIGVLLAGSTGKGKSTGTIACAMAGMELLGDDAIAIAPPLHGSREPEAFCVNASAKLTADGSIRQPQAARLGERLASRWLGETVLLAQEIEAFTVAAAAPLRAIVFPRRGEQPESWVSELSAGRALTQLTGSDLTMTQGTIAAHFEQLAALAEGVPTFSLEVGSDPSTIPAAVRDAMRASGR